MTPARETAMALGGRRARRASYLVSCPVPCRKGRRDRNPSLRIGDGHIRLLTCSSGSRINDLVFIKRAREIWDAARDPRRTLVESYLCLARRRARRARDAVFAGNAVMNTEHEFIDTNRHLVEVPDTFAVARWPRDADVATIARCILGTLKYEPHTADITVLRRALEGVIEHTARGGTLQKGEDSEPKREGWFEIQRQSGGTTMTDEENSMNKPDMPPSVADAKAEAPRRLLEDPRPVGPKGDEARTHQPAREPD